MTVNRREALRLGGMITVGVAVTAGVTWATTGSADQSGQLLDSDLKLPERFTAKLPIPAVAKPRSTKDGVARYELTQRASKVEIIPGKRTEIWGFDGTFPGPTFDVRSGRPITVSIANRLDVPTSTHLHGGVTPAKYDGFPTHVIVPPGSHFHPHDSMAMKMDMSVWKMYDGSFDHEYPLDQAATMLWYHDHRMDFTAPQVWRGLAGMFIVRDDVEDALPLPKGDREIPLMLCDRAFRADGSFKYPSVDGTLLGAPGVTGDYHEGVQGDVLLVNGAPWPTVDVDGARYRLRFLNASNARRYDLSLEADGRTTPFVQIGSDIGLLGSPQELDDLAIAPAERYDVIVDFSKFKPGTEVTLVNKLGTGGTDAVMRFKVGDRADDPSKIPDTLAKVEKLAPAKVAAGRTFHFARTGTDSGQMWTINDKPYDPSGTIARVKAGTVERWSITSDLHHPVHVHLGHFQVTSRAGKPPEPRDAGWKDTVDMRAFETIEVLIRFPEVKGRYMIHCHNLEHEDMAMMANFDVV
ncbi:multicopper oxidase family protein [Stackebrandtia sp.]|uniref:multicopper oxidase family protein n=1 Tax=Stackebrandtia sp. TaxID=2023065 RepID=UPI002D777CF4|nr:multicopper oxidase domain-containing protein [Stackebrandtia sp.]